MKTTVKIGILRETTEHKDRRVALTPMQCAEIMAKFPQTEIVVQPSLYRCFLDDEYAAQKIVLQENLEDCDILLGIKEVNKETLISGRTYFFFAHVIKQQPHNKEMFCEILRKNITLVDFELLTSVDGVRIAAFGAWAGMVGAYNALLAKGKRDNSFQLIPVEQHYDVKAMLLYLKQIKLPDFKLIITGGGRAANGAIQVLEAVKVKQVNPSQFLKNKYSEPVFAQIDPWHYVQRKDGESFDFEHFVRHSIDYRSTFKQYAQVADILVNTNYWEPKSPTLLNSADYQDTEFSISVIADVSCDIPGALPSTQKAVSFENPFYDYNPLTFNIEVPFSSPENITVMAADNLACALPRDSSEDFGNQLINKLFPVLFSHDEDGIVARATITVNGRIATKFRYLTIYGTLPD